MDTAVYANTFYVIASFAIVAVSVTLVIALVYLINVLREFQEISRQTKDTTSIVSSVIKRFFRKNKKENNE